MTSPTPPTSIASSQATAPALGWLLAVPALLGALITLVLPTVQTIVLSLQSGGVIKESTFVGLDNYAKLLGDTAFWQALGFTLSLTVGPLLVVVVVGPPLALALDRAGTLTRRAGLVVLSLAIVTFSPVGVAAAWLRGLAPDATGVAALAEGLRDPSTAPGALRLIVAAATFGVVCALALTAFLPALRGGTPGPAVLTVGALVALATVAVGIQAFSIGMVLTGGGPERATETLTGLEYDYAFRMAVFGPGASVAALTGVILGALGIAATVIAVSTRLRITLSPRTPTAPAAPSVPIAPTAPTAPTAPSAPTAPGFPDAAPGAAGDGVRRSSSGSSIAVGVLALIVVVVVALVCAWPWISGVFAGPGSGAGDLRAQVNTWLPAVVGALVSVGVAYLAALGIGGLRPLGRRSEWLLLVFAPWLFVGSGPLGVANWRNVRNLGLLDTFPALLPPVLVSVPALLVLTLLCKGLAGRSGGDFFGGVLLPSLPMAGVLAGAVALVNAQDLFWPLLVAQKPALFTAPVMQTAQLGGFRTSAYDVGASTPLIVVALALAAVVAAQLLYLDRLAVTVKGSRPGEPAA